MILVSLNDHGTNCSCYCKIVHFYHSATHFLFLIGILFYMHHVILDILLLLFGYLFFYYYSFLLLSVKVSCSFVVDHYFVVVVVVVATDDTITPTPLLLSLLDGWPNDCVGNNGWCNLWYSNQRFKNVSIVDEPVFWIRKFNIHGLGWRLSWAEADVELLLLLPLFEFLLSIFFFPVVVALDDDNDIGGDGRSVCDLRVTNVSIQFDVSKLL